MGLEADGLDSGDDDADAAAPRIDGVHASSSTHAAARTSGTRGRPSRNRRCCSGCMFLDLMILLVPRSSGNGVGPEAGFESPNHDRRMVMMPLRCVRTCVGVVGVVSVDRVRPSASCVALGSPKPGMTGGPTAPNVNNSTLADSARACVRFEPLDLDLCPVRARFRLCVPHRRHFSVLIRSIQGLCQRVGSAGSAVRGRLIGCQPQRRQLRRTRRSRHVSFHPVT